MPISPRENGGALLKVAIDVSKSNAVTFGVLRAGGEGKPSQMEPGFHATRLEVK